MALAAPERVDAPRALRRVGLRGAAPDHVPLGARRPASARRSSALFYDRAPRRADRARLLRQATYVTEKLVEEVERALDRPGHRAPPRSPPCAASASPSMQKQYAHRSKQPALLLWGREDEVTLAPVRRAPRARAAARAPRRLPAVRALPDDRGGRRVDRGAREVPRRGDPVKRGGESARCAGPASRARSRARATLLALGARRRDRLHRHRRGHRPARPTSP